MLLNNKFSTKNKLIYKMKNLNSRNYEFNEKEEIQFNRIEKYNGVVKK